MKKKILYPLISLLCLISQSAVAEKCPNPYNCHYYCHNGWAYDPTEWVRVCYGLPPEWQEQYTGISCNGRGGETRDYCEPPVEEGPNGNLR